MKPLKQKQLIQQAIAYTTSLRTGSCRSSLEELTHLLFVLRALLRQAEEVAPKEYAKTLRKGGKKK